MLNRDWGLIFIYLKINHDYLVTSTYVIYMVEKLFFSNDKDK